MRDSKTEARFRRHIRVRKKIFGISEKPRLNVFRSLKHIYAQVIDDSSASTIVSASTSDKALKDGGLDNGGNIEAAKKVGTLVASRALEKGIKRVAFDKGGNQYHGRVKALAESARKEGLKF